MMKPDLKLVTDVVEGERNLPHTTYARLRSGEWGLRVPGKTAPGSEVIVTKRDGSTKREIVGRVLWSGKDFSLATVAHSGSSGRSYKRSSDNALGGRRCPECGARDCPKAWNPHELCQED